MRSFKIGDLEIPVPIIQGGMGIGISLSSLASSVANMGGVGIISTVGIGLIGNRPYTSYRQVNIDALRVEIRKARSLTDGILGVNIMVALTNFADMVKTSIEEGIDIIFSGAGLPLDLPKFLPKASKTKLVPIVSSGRAAKILCGKWKKNYNYLPDAIVIEGPKAGGHLGFKTEQIDKAEFQLERLVPEVIDAVKPFEEEANKKIPVIAAGGIYTGKDIHTFSKLGASAFQMGTRFVATHECDASEEFKKSYINATCSDVVIINSPVGLPGRAISNSFLDKAKKGDKKPECCNHHCIITCDFKKSVYCIAKALIEAQTGNNETGFCFAGSNVYKVNKIISVKELFEALKKEYRKDLKEKEISAPSI